MFKKTFALILLAVLILLLSQIRFDLPVEKLKPQFTNAASRFIDINGMNIHYRDEGKGPLLVLLHGTSSSLHTWEGWTNALSQDFRIIRLDLPGYGLTGPNLSGDYPIRMYTDFLESFFEKLNLTHITLAGNSLGGDIAWEYVLDHPGRVDRLILVDSMGYPMKREPVLFKLGRIPVLKETIHWAGSRFLVKYGLQEVYGDDSTIAPELVERYYLLSLRAGNRGALIARLNTHYPDRTSEIPHLTIPTLILWGKDDPWHTVEDAEKFHRDIPHSQLKIFDGAGHVPMEEIPEETAEEVRKFLLLPISSSTNTNI